MRRTLLTALGAAALALTCASPACADAPDGLFFLTGESTVPVAMAPSPGKTGRLGVIHLFLRNGSRRRADLTALLVPRTGRRAIGPSGSEAFPPRGLRLRWRNGSRLRVGPLSSRVLHLEVRAPFAALTFPDAMLVVRDRRNRISPAAILVHMTRRVRPPTPSRLAQARFEPASVTIIAPHCLPAILRWIHACRGHADVDLRNVAATPPVLDARALASTRLSGDAGGTATVSVHPVAAVPPTAADPVGGRVDADDITRSGTYSGDLVIDPTADSSPKLATTLKARDLWIFPFAALLVGAGLAWLFVRRRERTRPREILQAALAAVVERHQKDVPPPDPAAPPPPYPLGPIVPDHGWDPRCPPEQTASEAEKLHCDIGRASSVEEFKDLEARVDDIAAQVTLWPQAVQAAGALREACCELPAGTAMRDACEKLLEPAAVAPDDHEAARDLVVSLREQLQAARLWRRAAVVEQMAQRRWDDLAPMFPNLPRWQQTVMVENQPRAIRVAYLDPATTLDDMRTMRPEERMRDCLRALTQLSMVQPRLPVQQQRLTFDERGAAVSVEGGAADAEGIQSPLPQVPEATAPAPPRSQAILHDVRVRDRWEFWATLVLTALVYFLTIYPDDTFGSVWQYLTALTAGFAGQLVINWQLLPWFRSYRPAPAAG